MAIADIRVVVVGAGPAGLRAAELLADHGLRPILIDEGPRIGGQIYRQPPQVAGFVRPPQELYGAATDKAIDLFQTFDRIKSQIDHRPNSLVFDLIDRTLQVSDGRKVESIEFDALILATGATDRIIPAPGWTLPGVFSLGGAQIALKHQGCAIGHRVVLAGTGPLLLLVAHQYAKAGAPPAAIISPAQPWDFVRAAPRLISMMSALRSGLNWLLELKRLKVPLLFGSQLKAVLGASRVEAIEVQNSRGQISRIDCDAVAIGYGLRSETQLADLAGATFVFDQQQRLWLPQTDSHGRAGNCEKIYLAGDGAGPLGADAAEARGRLAAGAALYDLGLEAKDYNAARDLETVSKWRRFQSGMARAFPFPHQVAAKVPDETIVCRCELVEAFDIRGAAGIIGANELNRIKAYTRLGMGRCQGRMCGSAAAEIAADKLGVAVELTGRLRGQPPVKPVSVEVMAGLQDG